jgi:hypothetical protein
MLSVKSLLLASVIILSIEFPRPTSAQSTEIYSWRDQKGNWHFSDKNASQTAEVRELNELSATKWKKSGPLKKPPLVRPPKGGQFLSKREKRCRHLEEKIAFYRKKALSGKNHHHYLTKKRAYQWLKQKEC